MLLLSTSKTVKNSNNGKSPVIVMKLTHFFCWQTFIFQVSFGTWHKDHRTMSVSHIAWNRVGHAIWWNRLAEFSAIIRPLKFLCVKTGEIFQEILTLHLKERMVWFDGNFMNKNFSDKLFEYRIEWIFKWFMNCTFVLMRSPTAAILIAIVRHDSSFTKPFIAHKKRIAQL